MNLLHLTLSLSLIGSSIFCATKKVKILAFNGKVVKQQPHLSPHQNVDEIILNGERLINGTLQRLSQLRSQKAGPLLGMVKFELLLFTSTIVSLSSCQTYPKTCPFASFPRLQERIGQAVYYKRRLAEELFIVKLVNSEGGLTGDGNSTITSKQLHSRASSLYRQTMKDVARRSCPESLSVVRLDVMYALYLLGQWTTRLSRLNEEQMSRESREKTFRRHVYTIQRLRKRIRQECTRA